MKKIFIDSDVILDFLLDRKPFNNAIAQILELANNNEFKISVSPITITNLNYIIGRLENKRKANSKTKKILKLVSIESVGQTEIDQAIESKFKDFEDAVQNYCAANSKHKLIITRNVKDYKESELAILTPTEFLVQMN